MLTFEELGAKQCRYPTTDERPYFFCGEATDGRPYCPEHDKLCHAGSGKDWQALAGMMDAVEQTIKHQKPSREALEPAAADDVLRRAENYFDEPQGLMART